MRLPVYDKNGTRTQEVLEVDEKIFGESVREVLLKEVVLMYEARKRVGTHSTKIRSECAGSRRKLWRQKGTGRARVGPARAPHWRGGGVAFGPRPRDYSYSVSKKAKKTALNSAWLAKLRDKEVLVFEEFDVPEPKTATMKNLFKNMGIENHSLAIAIHETNPSLWKSVRNLPRVSLDLVTRFNAYVLLSHDKVLITKKAFAALISSHNGIVNSLDRKEVYKK